jgi:hypothetical protein
MFSLLLFANNIKRELPVNMQGTLEYRPGIESDMLNRMDCLKYGCTGKAKLFPSLSQSLFSMNRIYSVYIQVSTAIIGGNSLF